MKGTGRYTWIVVAVICVGTPVMAQRRTPTFSIDFQGPTAGGPGQGTGTLDSFFGTPINEGAILTTGSPSAPPFGPRQPFFGAAPAPGQLVSPSAGGPGITGGLGLVYAMTGVIEVDALSYGRDRGSAIFFSVDEFAVGIPTGSGFPDVHSEGAAPGGNTEASGDLFVSFLRPSDTYAGNIALVDGDGVAPFGGGGIGLVEPNLPASGFLDSGDNLDAVDVDTRKSHVLNEIFFSLDSAFPDPLEVAPANSGTAARNGFVGGDVLVRSGGTTGVYASAGSLGLDWIGGADSDDLDALVLLDDGARSGTPPLPFYDPADDDILFSVRRGSAIIGTADALGTLIEEGDLLSSPLAPSGPPVIAIRAEDLGLDTVRSRPSPAPTSMAVGASAPMPGDDLVGADATLVNDFNKDGWELQTEDFDSLREAVLGGGDAFYDPNGDGNVDEEDFEFAVEIIHGTRFGDINFDYNIDAEDAAIERRNFSNQGLWGEGNVTLDNWIDALDLAHLRRNFGFSATSPSPEPSSFVLMIVVIGRLAWLRQQRPQ